MKPSVILLGSKPGSVAALSILLHRGWDIRHVVVCPAFDYSWLPKPSLRELAVKNGIPIVNRQSELPPNEVDFVLSYMYRYRVNSETRALARRASLNFHAAPLPEFGGWAFYNVAILERASEYGCSCHFMDEGFDTGPLLKVRRFPIDASSETALSLELKTQIEMMQLFLDFCLIAESSEELPCEMQNLNRMRYLTHGEFEALKEIPAWADDETIERTARAFWYPPYDGAYVRVGQHRIQIIPKLVRQHLGSILHSDDLKKLVQASGTELHLHPSPHNAGIGAAEESR